MQLSARSPWARFPVCRGAVFHADFEVYADEVNTVMQRNSETCAIHLHAHLNPAEAIHVLTGRTFVC
jgi:hypothetical protein